MKKPLILIIEDDNETRYSLEDKLREENFPVLSAGNNKQGLQILENFPVLPNIILLDSDLPQMTGDEFEKYKQIPVIPIGEGTSMKKILSTIDLMDLSH